MVWSWSHTGEAYENVRENIAAKPRDWLEICYAEWKANPRGQFHPNPSVVLGGDFDARRYERALSAAKFLDSESLAERIYAWAERYSTCSNGGWEAWCCPYGCHECYFSRERFACDDCGCAVENEVRGREREHGLCAACDAKDEGEEPEGAGDAAA